VITQLLLDFVATVLAGIVGLLPPMPSELDAGLLAVNEGIDYVMTQIAPLGYIVPFDAIAAVVAIALVSLTLWGAVLLVRVVLWLSTLWG